MKIETGVTFSEVTKKINQDREWLAATGSLQRCRDQLALFAAQPLWSAAA
jgi:hypothetical protein